jgi:oxygen-independent coproporphyrinogen-3 oxidase
MGRAHNADEALGCIRHAAELGYENISIDLIYGIPVGGLGNWAQNLHQAFSLPIQHLSCYGMTIEPRTRLYQMVSKGALVATSDEAFAEQFGYLMDLAVTHGFEHYEISNFAKPGFRSGHNSRYWNDDSYLGIGPSAHSYNGFSRQWNVSSNAAYIDSISKGVIPATSEELSIHDKYNEFVMTRLRTLEGVNMVNLFERFGSSFQNNFLSVIGEYCQQGYVVKEGSRFFLSRSGQFIADRIASDLFVVNGGKVT